MKKLLIYIAVFVSLCSFVFGARMSGMDLSEIFDANQLGLGYNSGQLDTSLYIDFGTESLRFSINVLELGGSLFNNTGLAYDNSHFYQNVSDVTKTDKVFFRGLPRLFVGGGYDLGTIKIGLGYGAKLVRSNDIITYPYEGIYFDNNPTPTTTYNRNYIPKVGNSWYGNDVSLFFEADLEGDNVIKVAAPIQFGTGLGKDYLIADLFDKDGANKGSYVMPYDASKNKAFAILPQIEWTGALGYLTGLRLTVPFLRYSRPSLNFTGQDLVESVLTVLGTNSSYFDDPWWRGDDRDKMLTYTVESKDLSRTIIGFDVEATISLITEEELADFKFIPGITFFKALSGSSMDTSIIVGKQSRDNDFDISLDDLTDAGYTFDKPWGLKVKLPFGVFVNKFLISISATPRLELYVIGSSTTILKTGSKLEERTDPFYGIGYALPIEFSISPLGNLSFNLGMLAEGRALIGRPSTLKAEVDGSVIWYF